MKNKDQVSYESAFERLQKGNEIFVNSNCSIGDISIEKRKSTFIKGQKPYAVIISYSDSKVMPESHFFSRNRGVVCYSRCGKRCGPNGTGKYGICDI